MKTPALYLDTAPAVRRFCESVAEVPVLGVDTEFINDRTYQPALALLQLAVPDGRIVLVDCVAIGGDSWLPLANLLADPKIVKVFHSALGDVEVLEPRVGAVPEPLWDTQLVTGLMGYRGQIGYGDLVENMTGVRLEKAKTLTDWLQRPLTPEQLEYAADDVRYLIPLYEMERERLKQLGRLEWAEQECATLAAELRDRISSRSDTASLHRGVKGWHRLDRRSLAILRELALWREEEARRRDSPRRRVLRDDVLVQVARSAPSTMSQLREIRTDARDIDRIGKGILSAVQSGRRVPDEECPLPPTPGPSLDESESALVSLLSAVLQTVASRHEVAPTLIATTDDLAWLIRAHSEGRLNGHSILTGWRGDLVGKDLIGMLEGRRQVGWNTRDRRIEILD